MRDPWATLVGWSPADLADTFLETHHALAILAAGGEAFAAERPDAAHRATHWDPARTIFVGAPFAIGYPFRLALRPVDLTLQLVERSGAPLGSLPLGGQTLDDAHGWVQAGLSNYMGRVQERLPEPMVVLPPHPVARGAPFAKDRDGPRAAVSALYEVADVVLRDRSSAWPDSAPVLVWPDRFDVRALLPVSGGARKSDGGVITVGMAPTGPLVDSWHWYVDGAGGAREVLDGRNVVDAGADAPARVRSFLDDRITDALAVLGDPDAGSS